MEAELAHLEQKISQLAHLCRALREENRSLRQEVLTVSQDNAKLKQKVEGAGVRVASILAKMPEEAL